MYCQYFDIYREKQDGDTLKMAETTRPWALLSPDGSYHELQGPTFFVGRQENVQLTLKSRSVDKEHAVITAQPDQGFYFIHDLESLNGTFVNEKRVQQAELQLKDTIRFGYDMNTFRVDLSPYEDPRSPMFDGNNNMQGGMMRSCDYLQDTDVNSTLLTSNKCCKGLNESSNTSSEQVISRLCHNCGSKTADADRLTTIIKGSNLYGQPSWWGWESSDDEFYTYPNSATIVTQAGTLAIPTQHCTVLQSRIQRNKARIEHSLKSRSGTRDVMLSKRPEEDCEVLKECSQSLYSPASVPYSHNGLQQLAHPVYNVPAFGAWEAVPQGNFVEGPEDGGLDEDEKLLRRSLSYHIPLLPEFGEIPEKPVSEKSTKTARRTSSKKQLTSDLTSSSRFTSEEGDWDTTRSQPMPDYPGRVFGMTEVNISENIDVQHSELLPKGMKFGKPKLTSPVKVKTSGPKPSTPRSVTETNRSKRVHGVATAGTSEDIRAQTKSTRPVARASSSGGSSVPSDCESRDSDRSQNRSVFTSTSDDSEGDHEGRTRNVDDKRNSAERRKKKLREKEKDSGEFSDKAPRSSSSSSGLPRANKTALLRALNSREAVKNSAASSSSRVHTCKKIRHRHSTPAATTNRDNSPVDSNPSLRIWSPSIRKSPASKSPDKSKRPLSGGSTPRSSRTISQLSGDYETQAAVDALFETSNKTTYVLPKELQMNRNDAKNKTFVLEEKSNQPTTSTKENKETPDAETPDVPVLSREGTVDLLRPKKVDNNKELPEALQPSKENRPVPRPSQPPVNAWMSLPDKGRSASPESLVSVPPATSPSPPSTPRSSARSLIQERLNCRSAPPQARRQWDVTDKPMENLMLSSVHAFTVELRLASESVLSKARDLYEFVSNETTESNKGDTLGSNGKQDRHSHMPEWKSSHAEIAGVFRNLRRVEFNLRTMDQALSFLCSAPGKETCKSRSRPHLSEQFGQNSSWKDFKVRARTYSWAEENKNKFPTGPPSDDEEVTSP